MESQYEKLPAPRTHYNKAYIDFYRSSQQHLDDNGHEGVQLQGRIMHDDEEADHEIESIQFNSNMNTQAMPNEQINTLQHRNHTDMRTNSKMGGENRRLSQEKGSIRTQQVGKEQFQQRQNESNARNLGGAKSALNNYGTTGNPSTQIKKNTIEKQILTEQNYQGSGSANYSQKTMMKSASQNKILFASPDSYNIKNQQIQSTKEGGNQQDKISFFKDKQNLDKKGNTGPGQEVLFKQHQQYSTGNHRGGSGAYQLKQSNHHVLSHCSTKECTFCKTNGMHSHSLGAAPCQAIYCKQYQLEIMMSNGLSKRYSSNRDYYNVKIINDLIYNENTHVVSIFKDYLILDDINEFLKRSYNYQETKLRLPKLCSFYDKYSQVFPNFVVLPESKYMFKNIQRKQKLIDEQYQLQEELARKQHQTLLDEDKLFNSQFYNSVYKLNDLSMSMKQYEDQAKAIGGAGKKTYGRIEDMKIDELMSRFLMKDSESNIQLHTTAGLNFSGFTNQNSTIGYERTPSKGIFPDKFSQPNENSQGKGKVQPVKKVSQPLSKRNQPEMVQKKVIVATNVQIAQPSSVTNAKKQKGSFGSGKAQAHPTKLEVSRATQQNHDTQGSAKTTPRLQKKTAPYTTTTSGGQQQPTASPDTKQALQSYLLNGIMDDPTQQVQVLDSTLKYGEMYESPNIKQTQNNTVQYKNLLASGSQTTLGQHQHANLTSSLAVNRQQMKSQASLPMTNLAQTQSIANLKKNARLSSGDYQKHNAHTKKAVSPVPPNMCLTTTSQNSQYSQFGSRNQGQHSTQKNMKQINSHAKYLSGGNDYYQKMMTNQQTYASQETVMSAGGSSNKKIVQSRIGNNGQLDLIREQHQERHDELSDHDIITGDDCEEEGIADERLGSPDVFSTEDAGRRSLEGRAQGTQSAMNQFLLTSSDDKMMLSQYTNYDQIKKHLEKYITTNQQQSIDTNMSQSSGNKNLNFNKSDKKHKEHEHTRSGSQRNMVVSASGSIVNDTNSSRNGTAQKHFESLKQKIRGVFDQGDMPTESGNKTPNKSSTHSKKSQAMGQNTRMSIEAKDMLLGAQNIQPCLSSTSAAGRTLSFSQTGFQNPNNYRSITNLQQRKGSTNLKEKSINDSKRLSQNRQSFKEAEQSQQKMIKRCATGKTLSINEVHHHTFGGTHQPGFLNSVASSATLLNPTFINSTSNQQNKIYQTQSMQQQAANTVRVMTPSYSLASLSKMVTPTTCTSPMTMTVTLAGSSQSRKQDPSRKGQNAHAYSHQQHSLGNTSTQTFLLADKNQKLISSQKNQNLIASKSSRAANKGINLHVAQQNSMSNKSKQSLQQSNSQATLQITPRALVTNQDLVSRAKMENIIQESSQNLSCTVSTENNSGTHKSYELTVIAAKTLESKHPKFMRTIEEISGPQTQSYNNILSSSLGYRKSTHGLGNSSSQAHFDTKTKPKVQTTTSSHQNTIASKKQGMTLATSSSVSHFKSPSQQIQTKKALQGKYQQQF